MLGEKESPIKLPARHLAKLFIERRGLRLTRLVPRLSDTRVVITADTLMGLIVEQIFPPFSIYLYEYSWIFDYYYYLPTQSELQEFLKKWKEQVLPDLVYKADLFDCDDFSEMFAVEAKRALGVNAIGMALGYVEYEDYWFGHAWNIAVVNDGGQLKAVCIEPQLGEIVPCTGKSYDGLAYYMLAVII